MIDKERYLDILSHIVWEYCKEIKLNDSVSEERKQYIRGYVAAARALNVFDYKELKEVIEKVHFNAFGKTIAERKQSESSESFFNKEFMEILTFIRDGISLKKK
ncbi:MAG: hypothetical protein ABSC11_11455 [Smithella sp.]|jgi:hypothetical protein